MCASTDAMFAPAPNILKHCGHVEVSSRRSAACSTVLGVEEGRKLVVQLVQREIGGRMREHSAAQNEPIVGTESPTRRGCGQWCTIVDKEKRNTCSFPIWGEGLAISVSDPEIRHPLPIIVHGKAGKGKKASKATAADKAAKADQAKAAKAAFDNKSDTAGNCLSCSVGDRRCFRKALLHL
ncbi:hypothetical protein B0H10DRAFT_1957683 [Mycena sp. CBHHK59/15]|nr:hypothetical protein B0H10DRAFT_1957683 [Mycena sp. CBHHK59/15]